MQNRTSLTNDSNIAPHVARFIWHLISSFHPGAVPYDDSTVTTLVHNSHPADSLSSAITASPPTTHLHCTMAAAKEAATTFPLSALLPAELQCHHLEVRITHPTNLHHILRLRDNPDIVLLSIQNIPHLPGDIGIAPGDMPPLSEGL